MVTTTPHQEQSTKRSPDWLFHERHEDRITVHRFTDEDTAWQRYFELAEHQDHATTARITFPDDATCKCGAVVPFVALSFHITTSAA